MPITTPNLNGPESVPIKGFVSTLDIVVCVYSIYEPDSDPVRIEHVDLGNREHRSWLGKVTYWACTTGHSVETMSKEDWEKMK